MEEVKTYLKNLERDCWSIYCKTPSHKSVQLPEYPKNLTPEILLRYALAYLSDTNSMSTKFDYKIRIELNKETGMITQLPNTGYGTLIPAQNNENYLILMKRKGKYKWIGDDEIPTHVEKLVSESFEWYNRIIQKKLKFTMDMILFGCNN